MALYAERYLSAAGDAQPQWRQVRIVRPQRRRRQYVDFYEGPPCGSVGAASLEVFESRPQPSDLAKAARLHLFQEANGVRRETVDKVARFLDALFQIPGLKTYPSVLITADSEMHEIDLEASYVLPTKGGYVRLYASAGYSTFAASIFVNGKVVLSGRADAKFYGGLIGVLESNDVAMPIRFVSHHLDNDAMIPCLG